MKFPTQEKSDPLFSSGWSSEASGRLPVSKILTTQYASVRTSGQHHPDSLQCLRRIQISVAHADRERQLATVRTLGQHRSDAALIKKCVKRIMERRLSFE